MTKYEFNKESIKKMYDDTVEECFERFKKIKYPKALITRNSKWKNEEFCVYLDKYSNEEYIPKING